MNRYFVPLRMISESCSGTSDAGRRHYVIRKTEKEVDAALCLRKALRRIPQTPTVQSLLASLYPRYRDPFERVNDAILKVNRATQTLTELTAEFASTYQVFQFDPWWRPGQFVLFDFYAGKRPSR